MLGILWWAWVGYSWLTSVVDPEGSCGWRSSGRWRPCWWSRWRSPRSSATRTPFAVAYALVRGGWLLLFFLPATTTEGLRHSIWIGLVPSTALGVGLLVAASFLDGSHNCCCGAWRCPSTCSGRTCSGPRAGSSSRTTAERHGLIFIIALGESIVAIGVGAEAGLDVRSAAVLGVALAAAMWWAYFDVVALVAARRLAELPVGREQNEMARDSYSFLHFPMVSAWCSSALGLKTTIAHG